MDTSQFKISGNEAQFTRVLESMAAFEFKTTKQVDKDFNFNLYNIKYN
jgi:hypothetical protein